MGTGKSERPQKRPKDIARQAILQAENCETAEEKVELQKEIEKLIIKYGDFYLERGIKANGTEEEAGRAASDVNTLVRPHLFSLGRIKFGFATSRSKNDPEKLLTPGILYCKKQDDDTAIRVHLFAAGIWDISLNMYVAILPQ